MTAQLSWRANTRDFGGGAKDRFKYDSLPKEVVKKTFGASTREVDFLNREDLDDFVLAPEMAAPGPPSQP